MNMKSESLANDCPLTFEPKSNCRAEVVDPRFKIGKEELLRASGKF